MRDREFERIVRTYSDMVYRISLNICANPEDSQDVMQNVFMRFLRKMDTLSSEEHIKSWLIRVAVNESRRLCSSRTKKETLPLEAVANTLFAHNSRESEVFAEIMKLQPKYRVVIYLYYYEGYAVKEISHILKINPATVRTQLSRARESLRNLLKEDNYD